MRLSWKPLGVEMGPGAEWFYLFDVAGHEIRFRGAHMASPSTMLTLDGDADRWRTMFPHPVSKGKFDHMKAGGFLMRECWAAQIRRDEAEKAPQAAEAPQPGPTVEEG